ncbi:MAG: hypothetical protein ABI470_08600 [Aquihabitans sp.]
MKHKRRHLRPLERVVLRNTDEGLSSQEIAWRLRRSPSYVDRVRSISEIPRSTPYRPHQGSLRPVERHVLKALETGIDYPEIASRLRRTPAWVERVESFANYKLSNLEVGR